MAVPALNTHSPLDSLARRTSARKRDGTSPRQQPQPWNQPAPSSPLIYSRFARDSVATASSIDNNSYLARSSVDSRNVYNDPELQYRYYDEESVYSTSTVPALRDSWQSTATSQRSLLEGSSPTKSHAYSNQPPSPTNTIIPTVIVSSPTDPDVTGRTSNAGRAPIIAPITSNFSRPVRPPIVATRESEEQKRRVLERNQQRRAASPTQTESRSRSNSVASDTGPPLRENSKFRSKSPLRFEASRSPRPIAPPSSGFSILDTGRLSPSYQPSYQPSSGRSSPNPPPPRSDSPASLYSSTYSYYQLDSANAPDDFALDPGDFSNKPRAAPSPPTSQPRTSPQSYSSPQPPATLTLDSSMSTPRTPQEYLQLGIQHHEANRLKESAICFERSANDNGGCGVGMLMWGLTLRHGWGCEKNEKYGFKWLRRAAESAVSDLENARTGGGMDMGAVQSELVLAIYEVGQCFFQGWGVAKDQKMAVSYYTVAAKLGDPDAQSDLAFCLANGKGCKKDKKEAAKWYRAAVAQGQSDIGLAWIYKEKYQ